jgi:hypothetical protein
MNKVKLKKFEKHEVISASEIGQYYFCSMAWYLQKCGYKPELAFLDIGTEKHKKLGEMIAQTQHDIKKSKVFAIAGYLLLILTVLILIFEVVL